MSEQPSASGSQPASSETSQRQTTKLSPFETSILEYVLAVHGDVGTRRACLIALLVHAQLLSRGARLSSSNRGSSSLIVSSALDGDPIRLSYTLVPRPQSETLASAASQLQLSVTETDAHLFISLTDTVTDKFGHLEISGVEHVSLDDSSVQCASGNLVHLFPHLEEFLHLMDENVWKPVLPSPPRPRISESERRKDVKSPGLDEFTPPTHPSNLGGTRPTIPDYPFPDYGRSDLDPIGGLAGRGGMILDPRRPFLGGGAFGGGGSFLGGPDVLPPGAVPPGARFDPFGPGVVPGRQPFGGRLPRGPDPDHALPPGFEDMYN
ncbi:unnamed protein product [Echinostoma caproni]|uniref:PI31_Prot_C domain-containing protein n=1 Tax=Echinostoma caproni TaxID=27848 RepID=A0A183B0W2_9TREM|nr:unnamed protein product [Echinostoma caproni]